MTEPLTRDDLPGFIQRAARSAAGRYIPWGVTFDDAHQELWVWVLEHPKKVDRWLVEGKSTRLYFALLDAAVSYGEKEKAARCGYDVSDISWYTPSLIQALMPMALDDEYDGLHGAGEDTGPSNRLISEGGDLLARVMDVRRAVSGLPDWVGDGVRLYQAGHPQYDDAITAIVDFLGGTRRSIGKRKVGTNAWAQSETRESA